MSSKSIMNTILLSIKKKSRLKLNSRPYIGNIFRRYSTQTKEELSNSVQVLKDIAYKIEERSEVAEQVAALLPANVAQDIKLVMKKLNLLDTKIEEPSVKSLWRVALNSAIPFIGFGFMDNAIMIVAGEAIDYRFGVLFSMSTMAAAAWGNWVSDLAGLWLAGEIEKIAVTLGLPATNLSRAQLELPSARRASLFGCMVGITIGCVLGMFPLLVINTHETEREKEVEQQRFTIFDGVREEVQRIIRCKGATMYLVDNEKKMLRTMQGCQTCLLPMEIEERTMDFGAEIEGRVAMQGSPLHIVSEDGALIGLCLPAFDSTGQVCAVIKATGKLTADGKETSFTKQDERTLELLCSHLSATLQSLSVSEQASLEVKEAIRLMRRATQKENINSALSSFRSMLAHTTQRAINPADISLMLAAEKGSCEDISYFLGQGAYVNVRDGLSRTPLHVAASNGHLEAVQLLLDHGANPFIVDQAIESPLQLAQKYKHNLVAEKLKKYRTGGRTKIVVVQ